MYKVILPLVSSVCLLSACGGGSDNSSSNTAPPAQTSNKTNFSMNVSDAPVDNATKVVVYFDAITLEGNGDPIVIDVKDENSEAKSVDLLTVQGSDFASLVTDVEIPTGEYSQIRLHVTDESYIEMLGGTFNLRVPSGELKLDGITAQANVEAAYTVEFDLRKSLVDPVGQQAVFLKPRGVRLVANNDIGTINGTVSTDLINDESCASKTDMEMGNAVYIYQGEHTDMTLLGDDADEPENQDEVTPFTTAAVNFNDDTQAYEFEAGYVPTGEYTVAFSCMAQIDEPETDQNAQDGFSFLASQSAMVEANQTTHVEFTATEQASGE
ncbi:DUF4382 domain-containing protein [Neptunicella marina]|uniref:DUF4382 domain-containing protein n=1 Tax=Neptunicella marina TaxID=2125989 RepID=A0A8J6ISK8_9ALTE|nr:DUF4382 domain-containing protein [Neptunicella marina]MBC3764638.1 DUF4382 domain-containing protein [Neptunicella marina]